MSCPPAGFELLAEALDKVLALAALLFQQFGDALVGLRFERTKRQVLELPLEQTHAEAVGQWRENVQRLLRNPAALFVIIVLQQRQALDPVTKLDQHHADIADNRHQQAPQLFRLLRAVEPRLLSLLQGVQLVNAPGQSRYVAPNSTSICSSSSLSRNPGSLNRVAITASRSIPSSSTRPATSMLRGRLLST